MAAQPWAPSRPGQQAGVDRPLAALQDVAEGEVAGGAAVRQDDAGFECPVLVDVGKKKAGVCCPVEKEAIEFAGGGEALRGRGRALYRRCAGRVLKVIAVG